MKIVCLGDSLTYGYGVPRKDGWVSLAAQATGHTLVNKGVSGDTTGGMLARFARDTASWPGPPSPPCRPSGHRLKGPPDSVPADLFSTFGGKIVEKVLTVNRVYPLYWP